MSKAFSAAASRSLVFRARPSSLRSLLPELRAAAGVGYSRATYLLRQQALLLEFPRRVAGGRQLRQWNSATGRQVFLNYPVYSRDDWPAAGPPDPQLLRSEFNLDILPDFDWPAFKEELLQEKSVSAQMLRYYTRRLLPNEQVVLRSVLATGVDQLLQSVSAGTALKIVGSLRTGTSFEQSDCDMNLWFYDQCCAHVRDEDFATPNAASGQRLTELLKSFADSSRMRIVALRGRQPQGFGSPSFPNRVFLAHLGLLLKDVDAGVGDVQCHTGARVPVIRGFHEFLGFHFDVSLSSRFNHRLNSLVSCLRAACPPFAPLLIVVKGICKESRLRVISSDEYKGQLTTFKLTALLIFFLQGCGYAPPLAELLRQQRHLGAGSLPAAEVARLRGRFTRDPRNLETLVKQFLRFLLEYDFSNKAIDLLNFQEVPRESLPAELRSQFMIVLHPVAESPTNVMRNVRADAWRRHCRAFAEALRHLDDKSRPAASDDWGLVGLFDFKPVDVSDDCAEFHRFAERLARSL